MSTLRKALPATVFLIVFLHITGITFYFYPLHPRNPFSSQHPDQQPSTLGRWGPSIPLPLVPVAMAVLPASGKVLVWSADNARIFSDSTSHTLTALFDPRT